MREKIKLFSFFPQKEKGKKSNIYRKFPCEGKNRIFIEFFPGKEIYIYYVYIFFVRSLRSQGKKVWWLKLPPHTTFSPACDKCKIFEKEFFK